MVKEKSTDFRDEQNTNERRDDFASLCFSIILQPYLYTCGIHSNIYSLV